jgi:hypothetical protein
MRDSVRVYTRDNKRLLPPSMMAFLHYIFSRIDADAAAEYCNSVLDGIGLEEGSPAYTVREKLMVNSATRHGKLTTVAIAAFLIKGWNAFREGRALRALRFTPGEEFPKAK